MKYTHLLTLLFLFWIQVLIAQTPKKVIVEHFTNSRCTICSSSTKNPAFYTNLDNHPEVLHISYHPSSPYANCIFSQHNPSENDERTKYYNTFGGTPDLVIQGVLHPASIPFGSPEVFSPYLDQSSEVSIEIAQTKVDNKSISATITITTLVEHDYESTDLLVGVAEKLIDYAAPNGEQKHHDVFRLAMTDIEGDALTLPEVGESVSFSYEVDHNAAWEFDEMYVYAILNDSENREVIQAESALPSDNVTLLKESDKLSSLKIFPNPARNTINISLESNDELFVEFYNIKGDKVLSQKFNGEKMLNVIDLSSGIYNVQVRFAQGNTFRQIVIIN